MPEDIAQLPTQARAAVEGFTERLFAGVAAAVGAAKEEISDGQADTVRSLPVYVLCGVTL